ncbi:AraC family ligand binding domain-containing protein [Dactylosporangium sp. CA-092794]|uniref:AraC family ligand binding domain-containing protein n=1 Tax=Dactylosporangium sp. CA-092794 TaxID=3239929 RepID=UPI003D91DD09
MKLMITGIDGDGRSCLESVTEAGAAFADRVEVTQIFELASWPPTAQPHGSAAHFANSPPEGVLQWRLAYFPPGHHFPPHHTDSIDLDAVVAGGVVLGLDDGQHPLGPGDCVVVRGIDHTWTAGPEGVVMAITRIGTRRAAS